MDMKTPSDKIFEAMADRVNFMVQTGFAKVRHLCESPIEEILLEAIIAYRIANYYTFPKMPGLIGNGWNVEPQKHIGSYRVDFLLTDDECEVQTVIECDGHDFHERTKEQAQRDRERDRSMQSDGFLVLRFTGSEIWRDPWSCVEQIDKAIMAYGINRQGERIIDAMIGPA